MIEHVPEPGRDPDEAIDATEEADLALWWAHLPDFIKPGYPLDMPPARLPFVQEVFTTAGAPAHCPVARCRRGRTCRGGEGPPCYRADRHALQQVLFLYWAMLFTNLPPGEYAGALHRTGSRYAPTAPRQPAGHRRSRAAR